MNEYRYSEDHQWVILDDDDVAVVGISDFAQQQLGDIVYVELPQVGVDVVRDDEVAVVESVKAASDIKAPVSGTIVAVNERLADDPGLVNADPVGDGWFMKVSLSNEDELDDLMVESAYQEYTENLA